ncbi:MAG: Cache 3/Cache 2 fusion domain-containing protein [Treponema sp.]|nr:Cache 3/Cache 2 fusion domain-containing protein [Candidatus Treponema merdequi]
MEQQEKKKKLLVNVLLIVGVVVVGLFAFLIWFSVSRARAVIVESTTGDIHMITKSYSETISNWISEGLESLSMYTNSDVVYNGEKPEDIGKWLTGTTTRRSESFDYVLFIDADGNSYYDSGKTGNHKDRAYYKKISSGLAKEVIENPTVAKATGKVSVMVVKGAYSKTGKLVGMFVGIHSLDYLQSTVSEFKMGETGYAFLLDGNGVVVSHKNKDFEIVKNFVTDESLSEDMKEIAAKMVAGETGSGYAFKGTPQETFVSFAPVAGTPWSIAICADKDEINNTANRLRKILVIGNIIIAAVILIVLFTILTVSLRPLGIVVDTVDGIATGNADLSQRLPTMTNNEIGQVVGGFNRFIAKIQDIIVKIKQSKDNLVSADTDLAAAIEDTESSITEILANIESVKTHITKQNVSVQGTASAVTQIASNLQALERMIENQASGVTEASAAIEQMIGNIGSVNSSVEKMASSFEELQTNAQTGSQKQMIVNERIEQIESQSVMLQEANAAIAAIAEQTNLLAMNAAIEAAHAGEAGKGFSVVADEIRKLSETSSNQSRTIGEQLNKIKESIEDVVHSSSESSQAFADVSSNIESTDELVRQIKAAMQEQQEGSKQVLESLQLMSDTTQEVRCAAGEMSNGSQSILHEVTTLKDYTDEMGTSMTEMDAGAKKINETGVALHEISTQMRSTITQIGNEIDQFKA